MIPFVVQLYDILINMYYLKKLPLWTLYSIVCVCTHINHINLITIHSCLIKGRYKNSDTYMHVYIQYYLITCWDLNRNRFSFKVFFQTFFSPETYIVIIIPYFNDFSLSITYNSRPIPDFLYPPNGVCGVIAS